MDRCESRGCIIDGIERWNANPIQTKTTEWYLTWDGVRREEPTVVATLYGYYCQRDLSQRPPDTL